MSVRAHPQCWNGTEYVHICHEPSGRECIECGNPAGTRYGLYWCPECDVIRIDHITKSFEDLLARAEGGAS